MQNIPLNTGHLHAYRLADALLVWHRPSDSLQVLQGLGCWIFLGLDQGYNRSQLWREYHLAYPDGYGANTDWSALINAITPLFNTGEETPGYIEEYAHIFNRAHDTHRYGEGFCLQVNHLRYQIISQSPRVLEALQRLCRQYVVKNPVSVDNQFEILAAPEPSATGQTAVHYQIRCNGVTLKTAVAENTLLPLLMDYLQVFNYQSRDYLLAIHSAVVVKNGHALLLPGESGAGKSTLCVSLLEKGFTCFSDELAVLDHHGLVQPLPLPMAVKTGSWPILQQDWPALANEPVWQRPDGRQLKYLELPEPKGVATPDISQQSIIFPHYGPDTGIPEWQALNPVETLSGLTQAGYQVKDGLSADKVRQLVNFAEKTPAYRLRYPNLQQAHYCLNKLLG